MKNTIYIVLFCLIVVSCGKKSSYEIDQVPGPMWVPEVSESGRTNSSAWG